MARHVRLFAVWLLLGAVLAGSILFSFRLAGVRAYRADECAETSAAKASTMTADAPAPPLTLFQVALSRVVGGAASAPDAFVAGRQVMLLVFWLNWILLATATGARMLSPRWLMALAAAATLSPFWDFGFEIRPDNLVLTGVLLTWGLVRFNPPSPGSLVMAGALVSGLSFLSLASLFYTLPLSLAVLAFPRNGKAFRGRLALTWGGGVLGGLVVASVVFAIAGYRPVFGGLGFGNGAELLAAISRLPRQAPLLLALAGSALILEIAGIRRAKRKALNWEGNLPEAVLFAGSLAALLLNPARSGGDLLLPACAAFLLAFRHAALLVNEIRQPATLLPAFIAVVVFVHLVPFGNALRGYFAAPNFRQENLMRLTEDLTDPAKDSIFDQAGLVPTRARTPRGTFFKDPPPVFIPSQRDEKLSAEERNFLRDRYVVIADDFRVLGKVLAAGEGTFEIVHPGRYRISSLETSDIADTYPGGWESMKSPERKSTLTGTVDGRPFGDAPIELGAGTHHFKPDQRQQAAVVWVGPNRDRLHRLGEGGSQRLFY